MMLDTNEQNKQKQQEKLEEIKRREAEDLAQILSQKYGIPYINLSRITIEIDALKIIPEEQAREGKLAVFRKVGKNISVGVQNPDLPAAQRILENLKRQLFKIELFMVSETSLERAWSRYEEVQEFEAVSAGLISISEKNLEKYVAEIKNTDSFKSILAPVVAQRELRRISEVVEIILSGAYALEASDVHIEPEESEVLLRVRLDGVLYDIIRFSHSVYKLLLSRVKLVSELKLNITDRPQDGRFTIRLEGMEVEVRVSILPSAYGESIVLRVLHPKAISVGLEDLGMQPDLLKLMEEEIKRPNGMIFTTGPTGSGKTTTLYAILKKINTPEIKIITIENPVEYHLEGISQSQVEPSKGYDFAGALRSILRQDPDVILVGEVRDLETAQTALNAALTGHLVLSTLHTNNAYGAIPRLIDLGVKPNILAPAINISMAQRLTRVLCKKCKKSAEPAPEEMDYIKRELADLPARFEKPNFENIKIWKPIGCGECNNTGYKGRVGIFEAFVIDEEAEQLILSNPLESEFRRVAKRQGRLTMNQDGMLKVIAGTISLEELERVVGK